MTVPKLLEVLRRKDDENDKLKKENEELKSLIKNQKSSSEETIQALQSRIETLRTVVVEKDELRRKKRKKVDMLELEADEKVNPEKKNLPNNNTRRNSDVQ